MRSEGSDGQNTLQSFNLGELKCPRQQRKYLKQIHINVIYKIIYEDAMFNISKTLSPLKYLITSYDMGTRPLILQRWIEATIYNDEYSKYGICVTNHNIILCNLVYKCEPKVFIEIQRNQYNPYHVNRCV